jgi:hypothetical protein
VPMKLAKAMRAVEGVIKIAEDNFELLDVRRKLSVKCVGLLDVFMLNNKN